VDACTMWFVKQPEYYDMIVTENLFDDIITDLAAIIQGGLGIAAGGSINPEVVSMPPTRPSTTPWPRARSRASPPARWAWARARSGISSRSWSARPGRATSLSRVPTAPRCGGGGTRTGRVRGADLFAQGQNRLASECPIEHDP